MKVTKEKAAAHRAAIVEAACELFRKRGFNDVGVAEITEQVGLTHGGFYGHFESKDALAAEACGLAFAHSLDRISQADGEKALLAYFQRYLSENHRDRPDGGCLMPALVTEIARQNEGVRKNFTQGIELYIDAIAQRLPGRTRRAGQKRDQAIALLSTIVGGMALARATGQSSPDLSSEILASLRRQLPRLMAAPD